MLGGVFLLIDSDSKYTYMYYPEELCHPMREPQWRSWAKAIAFNKAERQYSWRQGYWKWSDLGDIRIDGRHDWLQYIKGDRKT